VSEYLVGTAGHVDHGKTALLRALTGIDCDRLPEEKRRGITLDLGFAHLERDGAALGFVDVPGHERFVHNALAGLGGIRLLLLVVAADEGIRPQTREHLAIAGLLEIPELLVALTKCDLVDDDLAGLVELELEEWLAATPWAGAPVRRASSVTGTGIEELAGELVERARAATPRDDLDAPARLPVDRAFTPVGQGVVVTGTLVRGRLAVGDELRLLPGDRKVRVRGLQAHGAPREALEAGGRTAVQLGGIERALVERGDELVGAGGPEATRNLLARIRLLPDSPIELSAGREARLHLGAGESPVRVRPLAPERLGPGEEGIVALRLARPLVAARGDRLVLRRLSPVATLGGGRVLDPRWRRPRRLDLASHLDALAGSDDAALEAWAEAGGPAGLEPADAGARLGVGPDFARERLGALAGEGRLVQADGRFFHPRALAALEEKARRLLVALFEADRLADTVSKAEVARRLLPRRAAGLVDVHFGWLVHRGVLRIDGDRVAPPGRKAELSTGEKGLAAEILALYEGAQLAPPSPAEVIRQLKAKPEIAKGLIRHLLGRKRLVQLPGGLLFAASALATLAGELSATGWESFSVGEFKDRFGLSRKWAIPLLEHLDSAGVTRRVGDRRQLVRRASGGAA